MMVLLFLMFVVSLSIFIGYKVGTALAGGRKINHHTQTELSPTIVVPPPSEHSEVPEGPRRRTHHSLGTEIRVITGKREAEATRYHSLKGCGGISRSDLKILSACRKCFPNAD